MINIRSNDPCEDLYPWQIEYLRLALLLYDAAVGVQTNGGKSRAMMMLPFLLSFYFDRSFTAVIVLPSKSLITQMASALTEAKISFLHICGDEQKELSDIIFNVQSGQLKFILTTPESLMKEKVKSIITSAAIIEMLAVALDEAHMWPTR